MSIWRPSSVFSVVTICIAKVRCLVCAERFRSTPLSYVVLPTSAFGRSLKLLSCACCSLWWTLDLGLDLGLDFGMDLRLDLDLGLDLYLDVGDRH